MCAWVEGSAVYGKHDEGFFCVGVPGRGNPYVLRCLFLCHSVNKYTHVNIIVMEIFTHYDAKARTDLRITRTPAFNVTPEYAKITYSHFSPLDSLYLFISRF
jgi:hypothetical protein